MTYGDDFDLFTIGGPYLFPLYTTIHSVNDLFHMKNSKEQVRYSKIKYTEKFGIIKYDMQCSK